MLNHDNLIARFVRDPAAYGSSRPFEYETTGRIVLDMDSEHLPTIQFSWQKGWNLYCLTEEQAAKLEAAGFPCERRIEETYGKPDKVAISAYIMEAERSFITLCNFRRYGWCWTREEAGKYGYCHGPVYANGLDLHFLADNSRDVIRDTLVQCWAEMKASIGGGFSQTFQCAATSACLRRLLDEALEYPSEHAGGWMRRRAYLDSGPDIEIIEKGGEERASFPVLIPEGGTRHNATRTNAEALRPQV
jgi:hypothetical protein